MQSPFFTLSAVAKRLAASDDAVAVKTAMRRVEHWTASGLFDIADVDLGPKSLGRGRVRRYPAEALRWGALWWAMAEAGLGIMAMVRATSIVNLSLKGKQRRRLEEAMEGRGQPLFLVMTGSRSDAELFGDGFQPGSGGTGWFMVERSPLDLGDRNFDVAYLINLTEAFRRAGS